MCHYATSRWHSPAHKGLPGKTKLPACLPHIMHPALAAVLVLPNSQSNPSTSNLYLPDPTACNMENLKFVLHVKVIVLWQFSSAASKYRQVSKKLMPIIEDVFRSAPTFSTETYSPIMLLSILFDFRQLVMYGVSTNSGVVN